MQRCCFGRWKSVKDIVTWQRLRTPPTVQGARGSLISDLCFRDCFKAFYVHKFRAMLGKNRLIFPGEKVASGPRGSD